VIEHPQSLTVLFGRVLNHLECETASQKLQNPPGLAGVACDSTTAVNAWRSPSTSRPTLHK
jgi:hypothetical protein